MRHVFACLAVAMLLAGCSDGGAESTTTILAAPTTSPAAPGTTAAPPRTAAPTTTPDEALGPDGSGCTPGPGDLPDGRWFGEIASFDSEGISFDLACWFSGDAAVEASAEDGEESPPPNDYYVRNDNDLLRQITVDQETPVLWYLSGDPNDFEEGTFEEWIQFLEDEGPRLGIWVTIADDQVTEIEEMWVP